MNQFTVFGNEITGYGVECDGAIAYEADMPLSTATALAEFCSKNPDATFDEFITCLCAKYVKETINMKFDLEQKHAELQKIIAGEV